MDVFILRGIVAELERELIGGFISKIYQLNRYDLLFRLRRQGQERDLLISTHPDFFRIHLTDKKYPTPPTPPRFGAFLRKHINGARVVDVFQERYERVIRINLERLLDAHLKRQLLLLIELLGKKSNVLLLEGGKILDALHWRKNTAGGERIILPGQNYHPLPSTNRLIPSKVIPELMAQLASFPPDKKRPAIMERISGLPPLLAKEMEFASADNPLQMEEIFQSFCQRYASAKFEPQIITLLSGQKILCPWPLKFLEETDKESFSSMNQAADNFYYEITTKRQVVEQRESLAKRVGQLLKRLQRRRENLLADEEKLKKDLQLKNLGEILVANYSKLKKGMKEIEAWDYSQVPPRPLIIPLEERLDPAANVENYFRRYKKAKRGLEMVASRKEITEREIAYLESVLYQIEAAEDAEVLGEIREELMEAKILTAPRWKRKRGEKGEGSWPVRQFRTQEGLTIYCGKHNRGNEFLWRHLARGNDLWFHAQGIPGSHVLLKVGTKQPSPSSIVEAAMVAAYYSKGKEAGKIPVDYTEVKNLRKPPDSRPGYITYFHQKTIYVEARKEAIEKIKLPNESAG